MKPLEYYGAILASFIDYTKVMELRNYARILLSALAATMVSSSFGKDDPITTLQAHYNKISQLSIKKDPIHLAALIRKNASSSFEFIDSMRNSLDLGATVRQNTEQLGKVRKFNADSNKIIGAKAKGYDMIVTVKSSYDILLKAGQESRVTGSSISEDTWTKTMSGWKIKRSRILKESAFQDGKPLN